MEKNEERVLLMKKKQRKSKNKIYGYENMEKAVDECIENNILKDFLEENREEVIESCIFEFNMEREMEKLRRTEFEGGRKEGQLLTILKFAEEFSWNHEEVVQRISNILEVNPQKAESLLATYKI